MKVAYALRLCVKAISMIFNYFSIAWRTITKNKIYSGINIIGLTIGMAGFILIATWIWNEKSFDQFHENRTTLYKVWNRTMGPGNVQAWDITAGPLGKSLKNDFAEIKNTSRIYWSMDRLFSYGDKNLKAKGNDVDKPFLRMFSFPLLKGDPDHALDDVNNIVITEDLAKRIFGDEEPMNKMVRIDNNEPYKVSGVLRNLPSNTSFDFEYLVSLEKGESYYGNNWGNNSYYTFIQLQPNTSIEAFNDKIKTALLRYSPESETEIFLHPLTKWHLYSRFENGKIAGGRIEIIYLLLVIGLLVLGIACINFMNLSTAQSQNRAKEVGVRKVIGAGKASLIRQFLTESILIAAVAGVLAMILVELCLPSFNRLSGRSLAISYGQPIFWISLLSFVLLTGLLAGSYPAFFLSAFKPIKVLKGELSSIQRRFTPRKVLVVIQFSIAIILIVSTTIIYSQIKFVQQRNAGYNVDNLVEVPIEGDINKNFQVIKSELLSKGVITSMCKTSLGVTVDGSTTSGLKWSGMNPELEGLIFSRFGTSGNFISTLGLKLLEGRDINQEIYAGDTLAVLLNATAIKNMGLTNPVGKTIELSNLQYTIVGIFDDFIIGSPYSRVNPMAVIGTKYWTYNTVMRFNSKNEMSRNLKIAEAVFRKYNPAYPFNYSFVDQEYEKKFNDQQQTGALSALFSGLTIFISCMGLFGLAMHTAGNRKKEIGIRKVLGASVAGITNMLANEFVKLVIIAITIATPISWYIMNKWLMDFEYRISISWLTFLFVGLSAILIAIITISFQAVKAALANPVKSLRTE
ncbi:MAG: ABC transporter permease [Chitinophagaceae bacterium]|nr:MAG: ABC transporter permease [Chitinophagaceae bacterium]